MLNIRQEMKQTQQLNMNLNLGVAIDIMSKSNDDLIEFINKEANENIFVEFIDRDFKRVRPRLIHEVDEFDPNQVIEETVIKECSLEEELFRQLGEVKLEEEAMECARYIISRLDKHGFYDEDIKQASKNLGLEEGDFLSVLDLIKTFEPRGVACRNSREFLMSQTEDPHLKLMIQDYLCDVAEYNIEKISLGLKIPKKRVENLIEELKKLNPWPCSKGKKADIQYIFPEIRIKNNRGKLEVELTEAIELNINKEYISMISKAYGRDKRYLQKLYYRANYIKKAIQLRNENIKSVISALVKKQEDFFLDKAELKPLTMTELAEICKLSQSTVSRISSNKYLECNNKVYSLRELFNRPLSPSQEITADKAKEVLEKIINTEDKSNPYTDRELAELLAERGIEIKRRTVAKYRKELGINSKHKRRG